MSFYLFVPFYIRLFHFDFFFDSFQKIIWLHFIVFKRFFPLELVGHLSAGKVSQGRERIEKEENMKGCFEYFQIINSTHNRFVFLRQFIFTSA